MRSEGSPQQHSLHWLQAQDTHRDISTPRNIFGIIFLSTNDNDYFDFLLPTLSTCSKTNTRPHVMIFIKNILSLFSLRILKVVHLMHAIINSLQSCFPISSDAQKMKLYVSTRVHNPVIPNPRILVVKIPVFSGVRKV